MIGFNIPIYIKESIDCIKEAAESRKICGDGAFTKKCNEWMEKKFNAHKVLMTTSCTSALEMAAILLDLKPGDEVIMPSYTFVSTADAFVMVGAKVVFVDVNPNTMNIDEEKIKEPTETTEAPNKNMDIDVEISEDGSGELQEKIDELTSQLAEANDKYLRLYAEYDNYRKRTTKEKMEAYGDATCRCIAEILPVLDSFERAIEAECTDESYKSGMQMIYTNFIDVLKKIGVTEMEALGNEFDPNLHNAIKKTEDENFGENTICEVFQKGYMFNDRVIRHAVVAVAN